MSALRVAATVLSLVGLGAMAQAQEEDEGKRLFGEFCTACHGASATGGGEIADLLSVPVPDLTKLSANNDGEFPMLRVIHVIDGRTGMRAHGGPMPLFGTMFSARAASEGLGYGSVTETRGRILSIALYLESIQG